MAHRFTIGQTVELTPRYLRSSAPGPMKFVSAFPRRTAIRVTLATALPKNMNGSHLKAISRCRSAF